jgi:hypothetical protein
MMSGRFLVLALVCTVIWLVVSIAICIWAMVIGEYEMKNYEHPIAEIVVAIWSRLMSAILTLVLVAGCLYLFGL